MSISDDGERRSLRERVEVLEYLFDQLLIDDPQFRFYPKRFQRSTAPDPFMERVQRFLRQRPDSFYYLNNRMDSFDREQKRLASLLSESVTLNEPSTLKLDKITRQQNILSEELHHWLFIQSFGLDVNEAELRRFVPLRIYLSDVPDEGTAAIVDAINGLMASFDFEISDEFPEILGSWYKKWFARTKDFVSRPEVEYRLQKIERAVELKGLGLPQAEIDEKQANAVSMLISSLKDVDSAAMQSGSILLLKLTIDGKATIQAKTLTQREILLLENNQELLASPENVLGKLAQLCARDAKKSSKKPFKHTLDALREQPDWPSSLGDVPPDTPRLPPPPQE